MDSRIILMAVLCLGSTGLFAKTCELSIEAGDAIRFSTTEMSVAVDCTEVKLTFSHTGKLPRTAMGHSWVLTTTADMTAVGKDGLMAGLPNDYLKPGDERVIANTRILGGGEKETITFSTAGMQPGGDYSFFCPFPGHINFMKGKFIYG